MHNVGVAFSEAGLGLEGVGQLPNGRYFDWLEAKDYTVSYSFSLTPLTFT